MSVLVRMSSLVAIGMAIFYDAKYSQTLDTRYSYDALFFLIMWTQFSFVSQFNDLKAKK